MGLLWVILVIVVVLTVILLIERRDIIATLPRKKLPLRIAIADPRTSPVPNSEDTHARRVVEEAIKHNALHIYIQIRSNLNFDLLDLLLSACPSDYLLFWGDNVGTWKKIRERRSRQPVPKGGYREIVAHTPENRTAMVDLLRDLHGLGHWTYCTFPEQNRAEVQSYAENEMGWIIESLSDRLCLFGLTIFYNMDPPVEIEIWATRPEQYDRIIEIVNSYSFVQE